MNPGAVKMQLSSFLGQMNQLVGMQLQTVERMQKIAKDAEDEDMPAGRLIALGAFMAWSTRDSDRAVLRAARMLHALIAPLGLRSDNLLEGSSFRPEPYGDIHESLQDLLDHNRRLLARIKSLESELLDLDEEVILDAYPKETILDFQRSWEKQFDDLLGRDS